MTSFKVSLFLSLLCSAITYQSENKAMALKKSGKDRRESRRQTLKILADGLGHLGFGMF